MSSLRAANSFATQPCCSIPAMLFSGLIKMRLRSSCEGRCWSSPQGFWLLLFLFRTLKILPKYLLG